MDSVIIYTDGGCRGNGKKDSVGAYAFHLLCPEKKMFKFFSGLMPQGSTNNQAEIKAMYSALKNIKSRNFKLIVYSDSKYVIDFCNDWRFKWANKDWKVKKANLNQLRQLHYLIESFKDIEFIHTYGHVGVTGNEICDRLCNLKMDDKLPALDTKFQQLLMGYLSEYNCLDILYR